VNKPMPSVNQRAGERGKDFMQAAGIACAIGILGLIVHKAFADISALAALHSGAEFWTRLGRYFLANLAG